MSELPLRAQTKIMALKDAEQQARTLTTANQRMISETQYAHDINPTGDKANALAREITRLQAMQPENQARYRALANLNARVARFIDMLPANVSLDDAKPIKPKLKAGESHQQAVERLRGDIAALISERGRVERASPSTKEMKHAAAQYVQSLAERGTPRLIVEHGKFEMLFGQGVIGEPIRTRAEELLAWVDPMRLLERLEAMIDAMPKPAAQMDATERKERLAEIKVELFEAERLECAHIDAARVQGTLIEHRPNVDPAALLNLVVSRSSKANAA
jgi:hypothetical protein